jgi:hypothetical protein
VSTLQADALPRAGGSVIGAGRPQVSRVTVTLLAVMMAYADGFWMTSLQGAIGAIERTQGPFLRWLSDSTLMLPVFVLAAWAAVRLGHRRYGQVLRAPRPVLITALFAALAGTAVGVVALALSSVYDYHLQAQLLRLLETTHGHGHPVVPAPDGTCLGTCQALAATRGLHVRAVLDGSAVLLVTNLVLVGWVVALRGGQLDPVRRRR